MKFLYHGSTTQNIKILQPRKRFTPQGKIDYAAIYAAFNPAFAAAHAFPWSSDEGIDMGIYDGVVKLMIPEKFIDRLNVPISIYKVSVESFQHTKEEDSGQTWHSIESIHVLEEEKFTSVTEAMNKLGGEIQYI